MSKSGSAASPGGNGGGNGNGAKSGTGSKSGAGSSSSSGSGSKAAGGASAASGSSAAKKAGAAAAASKAGKASGGNNNRRNKHLSATLEGDDAGVLSPSPPSTPSLDAKTPPFTSLTMPEGGLHHKKGAASTSSTGSLNAAAGGGGGDDKDGDAPVEEDDGDIEEAMQQGWTSYQGDEKGGQSRDEKGAAGSDDKTGGGAAASASGPSSSQSSPALPPASSASEKQSGATPMSSIGSSATAAAAAAAAAKTEKDAHAAFTSDRTSSSSSGGGAGGGAQYGVPHSGQNSGANVLSASGTSATTAAANTTATPIATLATAGMTPAAAAAAQTAALAAAARKRKNVTLATLALLYDPPVEGCELKPYVLLKDTENRTVGLKSGDELDYKWFRGSKRICSLPKCKTGATLQCLSCLKSNGPAHMSYFCSDACLRQAWPTHRLLHQKSQAQTQVADSKQNDLWNHDDEKFEGPNPDVASAVSAKYPPLISNQWTEVSKHRVYSPANDDVGRCLRLECTYKPGGAITATATAAVAAAAAAAQLATPANASGAAAASTGAAAAAAAAAAISGTSGSVPNPHADLQEDVLELAGMAVDPSIAFTLRVPQSAAARDFKKQAEEKERAPVTPTTPGTPGAAAAAGHTPLQFYNPNTFTNTSNPKVWWYDDNDCGGSTGMTPAGWHFMETSPVLPAPTAPPPRNMIWKTAAPPQSSTSFKCLCYNVLAQIYATRQLYPYCAVWALAWNYRKNTLLREILSHNADIINLQEVQANHFDKFFQPNLSKAGYDGIFKRKNRETLRDNPNAIDGCAIFYKRERFALMEQYGIEFNEAARQQTQDRKSLRRLLKGNIALVVVLEELGGNDSSRAPRRQRKRRLCVANTHIFWDPEYADVKLWQTWILLQELEKLVLHRNLPLLLCGDFNSMTDSSVYELLANERVGSKHSVFKNDPCQLLPAPNEIVSRLPLVSAYSAIGEPKYTNYTGHFVGVLDYIFFSKAHLSCLGCLDVDAEAQLKKDTALPNPQFASDHISLVSELDWLHDA